jgi:nitroreductase
MVREASIAIMICCDEKLVKYPAYWQQDCAAATQNALLAVHAKGLGAVWVGIYPREDRLALFRSLIPFPENIVPFSLIPIGVPDEAPQAEDRFDPLRIHRDRW